MKRCLVYLLLLAAVLIVPVQRTDVGRLRPVQVVAISHADGWVVIQTDTDDYGIGTDAITAMQNLKDTTPASIYLDTADYLLVQKNAAADAESLRTHLKDTVKVYGCEGNIDLKLAAQFLRVHGEGVRFAQWEAGTGVAVLKTENARLILEKTQ